MKTFFKYYKAIILIIIAIPLATACYSPAQSTAQTPTTPAQTPVSPPADDSLPSLSKEQIDQRTIYYLAISTWADVIHSTYASPHAPPGTEPEQLHPKPNPIRLTPAPDTNFHHAIMSLPHTTCAVHFHRQRKTLPVPPIDDLFRCTADMIASSKAHRWSNATPLEQEARARQHLIYLWQSINPVVLLSTKFAAQRGVDLNPLYEPEFREIATQYLPCSPKDAHVFNLIKAPTPTDMAAEWHKIHQEVSDCTLSVTNKLFPQENRTTDEIGPNWDP